MEWHCRRPPSKINTQEAALKLHNKQASKGFKHKPIFNIRPYVYNAPLPLFVYFKFKHLFYVSYFLWVSLPRCHAASRLSTDRRLRSLRMTSAWTRVCPQAGGWYRYWEFWQQSLLLIWDFLFFIFCKSGKSSCYPLIQCVALLRLKNAERLLACLFLFTQQSAWYSS